MKKLAYILGISFVLVAAFVGYRFLSVDREQKVTVTESSIKKFRVGSDSMCYAGYCIGDIVKYTEQNNCNVGDICVFTCNTDKCIHPGRMVFHFVDQKTEEGYYLVGDPNPQPCGADKPGKMCQTYDSKIYGFVKEPDISVLGIVVK